MKVKVLYIGLLILLSVQLFSQNFPKKSNRLVYDEVGLLSSDEQAYFENVLAQFEDSTSNEVSLVIVNSLENYEVGNYAQLLAENWGIGKKEKDNGILVLIAPADKKISIQAGYGLEGVLPDAICKRIIELEIKPSFKSGNYAEGINKGIMAIISASKGEYKAEAKKKSFPFGLIIVIIVFILFIFSSRKGGGDVIGGAQSALPWWLILGSGSSGRGSWGNFSGGRGGFGGFGGGSFGGGGASGSW